MDDRSPGSVATVLGTLDVWVQAGMLRHLDVALAAFVHHHDRQAAPCVLLAAALASHMEGRGHSCLPLSMMLQAVQQPQHTAHVLGWSQQQCMALRDLLQHMPAQPQAWVQALSASALVHTTSAHEREPHHDAAQRPLVLSVAQAPSAALLYLRRYWHYECTVADYLWRTAQAPHDAQPEQVQRVRQWLDRLFPESSAATFDWQKMACALAWRSKLTLITGGPGTGKTYTAARVLALLLGMSDAPEHMRIALAAPTGKAAARLKSSIDEAIAHLASALTGVLDLAALTAPMPSACTLHKLLGTRMGSRYFQHNAAQPLDVDVLIVDEASMIHLEMMAALLDALPPHARLIVLGDQDQLASVEPGSVLAQLCATAAAGMYDADTAAFAHAATGQRLPASLCFASSDAQPHAPLLAAHTVMLRHSRRFGGAIGQLAQAVNAADVSTVQALLSSSANQPHAELNMLLSPEPTCAVDAALSAAEESLSWQPFVQTLAQWPQVRDSARLGYAEHVRVHAQWVTQVQKSFAAVRLLCALRNGPWGVEALNARATARIQQVLAEQLHMGSLLTGQWWMGRAVMVTRNDAALGVFNGDVGIALPAPYAREHCSTAPGPAHKASPKLPRPTLRVYFEAAPDESPRGIGCARLTHVEGAFAMTIHKSQGSEFAHTLLLLPSADVAPELLTRELLYTGITRAKQRLSLITPDLQSATSACLRTVQRLGGLDALLQEPRA